MNRFSIMIGACAMALASGSASAAEPPPGLVHAELLAPYATPQGTWMTALRLDLAPGWKTYWRSPGDTGVPPSFDWTGTSNLAGTTPHWPQPEIIESGGERTLGYHEELILPIELIPARTGDPVAGNVTVDLGLCEDICVPAHLELVAPAPASTPDPRITAALARVPTQGAEQVSCTLTEIEDGVRIAASVPAPDGVSGAAALEFSEPSVWVSQPDVTAQGGRITATADFVGPTGKPFPLDPAGVRLTLIGADRAVEYQGCTPA